MPLVRRQSQERQGSSHSLNCGNRVIQQLAIRINHAVEPMPSVIENPNSLTTENGLADKEIANGSTEEARKRCVARSGSPLIVDAHTTSLIGRVDVIVSQWLNRVANFSD